MIWPLCGFYIINNFSKKQIKNVLYVIGILFLITIYTTCVGCIEFPNAARMLASSKEENEELEVLYHSMNIGGFMFVYTVLLIAPLLVYLFKNHNLIIKIVAIVSYLSLFILAIITEYTTALLLVTISALLFFLSKRYYLKKEHLVVIGILSVVAIAFNGLLIRAFVSLSGIAESEQISERVHDISIFISGSGIDKSSDLGQRTLAFSKSIDLFLNNILFGAGVQHGGGHSYILDTLAQYGLIGLGILIAIFKRMYMIYISPHSGTNAYVFVLALYVMNLIQCALNTTNSIFVLCFVLPLFMSVYYVENRKQWQKGL